MPWGSGIRGFLPNCTALGILRASGLCEVSATTTITTTTTTTTATTTTTTTTTTPATTATTTATTTTTTTTHHPPPLLPPPPPPPPRPLLSVRMRRHSDKPSALQATSRSRSSCQGIYLTRIHVAASAAAGLYRYGCVCNRVFLAFELKLLNLPLELQVGLSCCRWWRCCCT